MKDEIRRFDPLNRVVRDTRRDVDSLKSTVLARLGTHTHPPSDSPTTGVGAILRGHCTADTPVNNEAVTFGAITGMDVTLESTASYVVEGWLVWESNTTADIRFAWPSTLTGLWSLFGPVRNQEPIAGSPRLNYIDTGTVSVGVALSMSGDTEIGGVYASAILRAFVTTALVDEGTAGIRFAQATADVSNTTVKAGSWIRWTRVA